MNKKIIILALIIALLGTASARYISISTTSTGERITEGDSTIIGVRLINTGDEAAHDVRISLLLPAGFSANELKPGRMEPDKPYEGEFTVSIDGDVTSGTYLVAILTDYRDANSYPFSSVTQSFINLGEMTYSDISGTLSKISISPEGSASTALRIRNQGDEKRNLRVRLFLPRELATDVETYELELGPGAQEEHRFKISSFGALAGSTYIVFASMEYDEDNLHYTSTTSGMVEIVTEDEAPAETEDEGNPFGFLGGLDTTLLLLIGSFLLLVVIFVALSTRKFLQSKNFVSQDKGILYPTMKSKNEKQRKDIGDNPDAERGEESPEGP